MRPSDLSDKSGILKIVELIIGIVMLILDLTCNDTAYLYNSRAGFTKFILCAIVITVSVTAMLIVAIVALGFQQNTSFELLYNIVACILLIIAGIAMLVKSQDDYDNYSDSRSTTLVINGVLALVNGGLYAFGAFLAR